MSDEKRKDRVSTPPSTAQPSLLRQVMLFGTMLVQVPMSMLAFGLLGAWASAKWHMPLLIAIGVFFGLITGVAGLIALIKKMNGG